MKRVFAVLAFGSLLAGCESFNMSMPSFDAFKPAPEQANVRIESEPAGAEARGPAGTPCRTPCSLTLPANGVSNVVVSLQGYLPQTVPVSIAPARDAGDFAEAGSSPFRIDPDPVVAVLQLVPPPPAPVRKKKPAPRAKPKPRAAAPAPAAAPQDAAPPPPPPISGFGPPNPPPAQGGFGPPNPPPATR